MSSSQLRLSLQASLRGVYLNKGACAAASEQELRNKIEEGYQRGFEAGQKALAEQLIQQRKQLLDIQNGVLRSLEHALPGVIAECERSIVLLALEAARKVVQESPIDRELVERVVRSALSELKDTAEYEVMLHPEDLSLLHEFQSDLLPKQENSKIKFIPSRGMHRGDCVVHTRHGSIAAFREQIFEKIERVVLC